MNLKKIILLGLFTVFLPGAVVAFDGFSLYAAPTIGYSWFNFQSMEIEKSFVRKTTTTTDGTDVTGEDTIDEIDTDNFDADDLENIEDQVVGSKASFKGAGIALGISAGIELFSLTLGLHYAWSPVKLDGYSREYKYDATLKRARGVKSPDAASIDTQRVLFELGYGLKIARVKLTFTTRIGSLILSPTDLALGRAVDNGNGLTGDLGVRLDVYPLSFMAISLGGWYGFFTFTGKYEGTYGTAGGLNAYILFKV